MSIQDIAIYINIVYTYIQYIYYIHTGKAVYNVFHAQVTHCIAVTVFAYCIKDAFATPYIYIYSLRALYVSICASSLVSINKSNTGHRKGVVNFDYECKTETLADPNGLVTSAYGFFFFLRLDANYSENCART